MANELRHKGVGTELEEIEFEDVTLHQLDSQATGDLIKAISDTQLSRLPIDANGKVLTVVSGVPAWADAPAATLEEDIVNSVRSTANCDNSSGGSKVVSVLAGADSPTFATCTTAFAAGSMAVGFAGATAKLSGTSHKFQLYMGGVLVAEQNTYSSALSQNYVLVATRALSGSQIVFSRTHNYDGVDNECSVYGRLSGNGCSYGSVAVGSIKVA